MRDIIVDVFLVVIFLVVVNAVIKGPEIKTDIVNQSTSQLESDIKNEEQLEDHYVIYDDGKENAVAKGAKAVSNGVTEFIRMVVVFIGDFFSMMVSAAIIQ